MPIESLLPLLVPGILLQILVQAYFIHHCWHNEQLATRSKVWYIVAIALFNIPAAAVYLFLARGRRTIGGAALPPAEEDRQVRQGIFVSLLVAFEIIALRFMLENRDGTASAWLAWLIGICFVCLILDGLLERPGIAWLSHLLVPVQILTLVVCVYLEQADSGQFLIIIAVAGIINRHTRGMALGYGSAALVLSMAAAVLQLLGRYGADSDELISRLYVRLLLFVLAYALFYSLKQQLRVNQQLEQAIQKLREQAGQLEQMSALAERNRIVGEIHDTVGHTLTTAVVALESGQQLLTQDPAAAADKISLARQQVRRGLQDLRSSIRTIQSGGDSPFPVKLDALLETLRTTTDLKINAVVEQAAVLLPVQQHVLLQAIRELATNSLKHGHSQTLDLLLQTYQDKLHLTVSDDGCGTDDLIAGFGLRHMRQQVESIGGLMRVSSEAGEGFTVHIVLPLGQQAGGD